MGTGPIFHSSSDLAIWKRLTGSGGGKFSFGRKPASPENIADEVLSLKGPVDSAILVKLMDTLYDSGSERLESLLTELTLKQKSSDTSPTLEAALLFHKMGNTEKAKNLLGSVGEAQNAPLKNIVRARLLLDEKDMSSAKVVLVHGRCSDPLDLRIYKMLEEADPGGGWMYYRNIELLHAGRNTVACGASDTDIPQKRLYDIYGEWHKGNRDAAGKALANSAEYADDDGDFVLAAARMAADEEDWHSSEMLYDRIIEKGCTFTLCEAARVSLMGGNIDKAMNLYHIAENEDPHSPLVLKGLIEANVKLGFKDDMVNNILTLLDSEFADLEIHLECAEILVSEGMHIQADPIIRRILMNYPENVEANLLMSKNEMALDNLNAALDSVNTAVKTGGDNRESRLQRARVWFAMGKPEKAMKDARTLLRDNPEDLEALIFIKDIYAYQGKRHKTLEMYDKILDIDPENAQIILEYSEAKMHKGDAEGSLISFRRAIAADPRPANFISVVKLLVNDKMYRDAVNLCEEMDDRYGAIATVKMLRGNAEYALGEYLKASVSFAAAAALAPKSSEIWHSKGMADEAAGDLDSAEDAFNRAVLIDLDNPEYWISKAAIQERKKDYSGAVESLNRVIELKPDNLYALVKKGMIFSKVGKYDESLFFLDMAIMVNTWNKDIYDIKKEICIHAGKYEEAIAVCMEIMAIDSGDIYAVVDAADCMMRIGERSEALSLIDTKLLKNPKSVPLLLSKKSILTSMGNYPELIAVCYRILERDPGNRSVKMDLAQALANNGDMVSADRIRMELYNEDASLEPLEEEADAEEEVEAVEVSEPDAQSLFNIARSLYSTGDMIGAARMTERALEADPGNTDFISFRVEIYVASRDFKGAIAEIERGLEYAGPNADLFELEGNILAMIEDYQGAAEAYSKSIEMGNNGHDIHVKRGDVHMMNGNKDEAISDYMAAVSKSGPDNTSRIRLASIYISDGNIDEADRIIQTVLSVEPGNSEALGIKAEIYSEQENTEGLIEIYEQLSEEDADEDALRKVSSILSKHGLQKESSVLSMKAAGQSPITETDVPDNIKRLAEKLLRRAYVSKRSLDDPGILNVLETDDETAVKVRDYLADMRAYGVIEPGTPEFDRMESLSYYAVVRAGLENIDTNPIITIPSAFVAGGTKDADEAKTLVSYIFETFDCDIRIDFLSKELTDLAYELDENISIYEIMKNHKLGVYSPRC